MNPIFLIVGPPAVGKSTTSRALAARFPRSIHVPVDDLRDMVISGRVLPSPEWSAPLMQQIALARGAAVSMALAYRAAGFAVILDDFVDPHWLAEYEALLQLPGVHRILLYPDQEIAFARNLERSGDSPVRAYIDDGIRAVYSNMRSAPLAAPGAIVLDTSALSVAATVDQILERTGYHTAYSAQPLAVPA